MKTANFFFLTLLFAGFSMQAQSPWTRSKAGFYTQLAYNAIPRYDELFGDIDGGNGRQLEREISEGTLQFYGEYGLGRKTTVLFSAPLRFLKSGNLTGQNSTLVSGNCVHFGNISLAARHRFLDKNVAISGQLRLDLPTSRYDDDLGLRGGYDAITVLPMLSMGKGYRRSYWFGYGGFGYRSGGYSDFLQFGIEAGWEVKKLYLIGFSEYLRPLENGEVQLTQNNLKTGMYVDNQGFWSVGGKLIYQQNRFYGFGLHFASVVEAYNLPRKPALGVMAYFKWD